MSEEEMRAQGVIDVYDEQTGEALGRAVFDGGRMEWRWYSAGLRHAGWRKTGAKAVAAIEKATKSREERKHG